MGFSTFKSRVCDIRTEENDQKQAEFKDGVQNGSFDAELAAVTLNLVTLMILKETMYLWTRASATWSRDRVDV